MSDTAIPVQYRVASHRQDTRDTFTLGLKPDGTVVQINDSIVERERFDATLLSEGDHVELVRIVGGG